MLRPRVSSVACSSVASLIQVYISYVICELTDAYFVWCYISRYELSPIVIANSCGSCLESHSDAYTVFLSYQYYDPIPVTVYHLAPLSPREERLCRRLRNLCLRTWQIVIHCIAWCYTVILVTYMFFELNQYSSGHGVYRYLCYFSFTARCSLTLRRYMLTWFMRVLDSITVTGSNVSVWLKYCSSSCVYVLNREFRVDNREDAIKTEGGDCVTVCHNGAFPLIN